MSKKGQLRDLSFLMAALSIFIVLLEDSNKVLCCFRFILKDRPRDYENTGVNGIIWWPRVAIRKFPHFYQFPHQIFQFQLLFHTN